MNDAKRDQFAKDWDVIVIGSGMGGMATASALSQTGHKVLLLEQYQTLAVRPTVFHETAFAGMQAFTI